MLSYLGSTDEVVDVSFNLPGCVSTQSCIIATKFCRWLGVHLSVYIRFRFICVRRGDDITVTQWCFLIVLEDQAGADAFGVNFARLVDCSGLGRLPIHPIEDDQENVFLAHLFDRFALQPIKIGLIGVIRIWIDRIRRKSAVERFDFGSISIETSFVHVLVERSSVNIGRYQAVGVVGPGCVAAGSISPMPPGRGFRSHRSLLQLSDRIQRTSRRNYGSRFFGSFLLLSPAEPLIP